MHYLEVKLEKPSKAVDTSSFVSEIIRAQDDVILRSNNAFDAKRLLELGFLFNPTTQGYAMTQTLDFDTLFFLAKAIDLLKYHKLMHGFVQLKIHHDRLYFWDTALIYEGMDSFEYCLKYHNIFPLESGYVLTKSDAIHTDILEFANCIRRYQEPTLAFITKGLLWDAKEGAIIENTSGLNRREYISKNDAKIFDLYSFP